MKYVAGPWKFMPPPSNGLLVSRDESQIVGTFHNAKEALAQGLDSRAMVAHAPAMFELLKRWESVSGPGAPNTLNAQTTQLLHDIRNAKGVR